MHLKIKLKNRVYLEIKLNRVQTFNELRGLNEEAIALAKMISGNYKSLNI